MAGLPDLVVRLAANSDKFDKGMKSAKSSVSSFASVAKTAIRGVQVAMVTATAGVAAVAGAMYGLSGRISKLAGIADEAVKTGLSGNFLQRLGYAADQSGISVETLTSQVKKLTIAIGKGDAKQFASIGLDIAELKAMKPEDQFKAVVEAISKLPSAADKAAAAMRIFGRGGIEMTGLFSGKVGELNRLLKEAADLGIGVSDEDLAKAAAADDAIQRMKASFGSLIDKVAITFAPAIENVTNKITEWMTPLNKAMDQFNAMGDKWTWLGDTAVAVFDVAIENIQTKFFSMLTAAGNKLRSELSLTKEGQQIGEEIAWAVGLSDEILDVRNPGMPAGGGNQGSAQQRLDAQMAKLKNADDMAYLEKLQGMPTETAEAFKKRTAGMSLKSKGSGDFSGLFGHISEKLSGPIASATMAGQGIVDKAKRNLNWLGDVATAAFTGEGSTAVAKKQFEPRTSGAMQRGSAEAYSTIVQAMMRGTKDPVVQATEKQTKELIKHLKPKPPAVFAMIGDFLS